MQKAEDEFRLLVGGPRVRVVEQGGDVLAHLLGRNYPWASRRMCGDEQCVPCRSKVWLQSEQKEARKNGTKLPDVLDKKTSNQCRREGCNYSLQCLDCALGGVRAIYWGESGCSSRQRHRTHDSEVEKGVTNNPLVQHAIEAHGGQKPHYLALINRVEPRPLYHAVREAVQMSQMPEGVQNMNRCMEWRTPRIPVLSAEGGDPESGPGSSVVNPRPDWSRGVMDQVREGRLKRIRYWDTSRDHNEQLNGPQSQEEDPEDREVGQGPLKKARVEQDLANLDTEGVSGVGAHCRQGPTWRVCWTNGRTSGASRSLWRIARTP